MILAFRLLLLTGGVVITVIMLSDVFQSVIVPRAVGLRWRASAHLNRFFWRVWKQLVWRFADPEQGEEKLAVFAPFMLVFFLAFWVTGLVLGFGLCFFALSDQLQPHQNFGGALYYAGTALLTLGFGDITGATGLTHALSLIAAASGLGTVAVVTAYLFSIFGAFQRRETFVVLTGHAAGRPLSGVTLLERYAELGLTDELGMLFRDAQSWAAELMESHLAYPVLMYFRSSHDDQSWVATLGALLDAAALAVTTIQCSRGGQIQLFRELGEHVVHDFGEFFQLDRSDAVGVETYEYLAARERLRAVGYTVGDPDHGWTEFSRYRRRYASALGALASYYAIPPAQWIGDRSYLPHGG